jgi:formate hydrogenlyase transcriptional activator
MRDLPGRQHGVKVLQTAAAAIGDACAHEIVGKSAVFCAVLDTVGVVAPTDTTVLIHGETGTGKELIASAVHTQGLRRLRPLIKVNCAAISPALVESELFGHVKGAFTGAVDRREGRFELADGGTLFLDEVSALSLEAQAKLLRVLQEREFELVGSSRTVRVDVRVIAATNRDLSAEVRAGRFRPDLFYRLNVFPIELPPLRERREDILPLAEHFMHRMAQKLGKPLERIAPATAAALHAHSWPGNVRDLKNTIERAAVLASGATVIVSWELTGAECAHQVRACACAADRAGTASLVPPGFMERQTPEDHTLLAVERRHIAAVLIRTRGVIEGAEGAARALGLKPSTLRHRIKKLGIPRASSPAPRPVAGRAQRHPALNRLGGGAAS